MNTDDSFGDQILEDVVHHGLESGRTVGEAEEHNQGLKESSVRAESGLPLVTFLDADIVVSPADIQLGEVACTPETIYKVGNKRKRVDILNRLGVQCSVVLNQPEGPILLLDEEDRCCHR